jgi:hypothetical protein
MKLTEETPIFKLIAEREHEFYLGNIKENIKQQILENQEKLEKIKEIIKFADWYEDLGGDMRKIEAILDEESK